VKHSVIKIMIHLQFRHILEVNKYVNNLKWISNLACSSMSVYV